MIIFDYLFYSKLYLQSIEHRTFSIDCPIASRAMKVMNAIHLHLNHLQLNASDQSERPFIHSATHH